MAARLPRRSFATPFVVTLAATVPACFVESNPRPQQPAPATTTAATTATTAGEPTPAPPTTVIANPPRPTEQPAPPPADPKPPTIIANPPRPTVAQTTRRWHVTRSSGTCLASSDVSCPKPAAGQPMPTCNPPAPQPVACPERTADGESFTVVQWAGQATCQVENPPLKCPPKTMCNPPPPRQATCPQ